MTEAFLTPDMWAKILKYPKAKRDAAMKIVAREEWNRCADDITYWLDATRHIVPYVYTRDPKPMHVCNLCNDQATHHFDKRQFHLLHSHGVEARLDSELKGYFSQLDTIRPFTMLPYFIPLIETLLTQQLVAVEKSRDMMATWLVVAFYAWDTLFHKGRQNIFQSENAQKTRELVSRIETIYTNMPKWLKLHKGEPSEGNNRAGLFRVPSLQSEIIGFPAGADKVRMYHPTGFFSDEAAFNPDAGECFGAIKPAIQGGGRYTAISTANPSFFYYICRDLVPEAV